MLLSLAALLWPGVRTQASALESTAAALEKGPAARIRGRLEQATASLIGQPADLSGALAAADATLVELTVLAHASADVGALPLALVESLAVEAVGIRTLALTEIEPLPSGFRGEFLAKIAPGAMIGDWRYGVPASITMAQGILESGWGKVAPGYNLFGIKGEGSAGSQVHRVVEWRGRKRSVKRASFRSYRSMAESLEDHARLLGTAERYAAARAVSDNAPLYAKALQGKYATDPRYASKLIELSLRYGLDRFDWHGVVPFAHPPAEQVPVVISESPEWTAFAAGDPNAG